MLKCCASCKLEFALTEFGKDKNRKDGLNVYCKICARAKSLSYTAANPDKVRAAKLAHDRANQQRIKAWRAQNSEKLREYWRAYGKAYRANFKAETAEKTRRQQAARRRAVPLWFDREAAAAVYAEAERRRAAGEHVHVDHIVPINGKTVCGLHWHGNLQVVTAAENLRKANKLIEELARQ